MASLARLPLLLAAAYTGLYPRPGTAQPAPSMTEPDLDPHEREILARLAWLLFPLPELGPGPYQRAAAGLADAVRGQPGEHALLREGIRQLDVAAGGDFLAQTEAAQAAGLKGIETGGFFQFVYAGIRTRLFDDREVWQLIGYEGSSLEKGGYIHRGLDDIDWL